MISQGLSFGSHPPKNMLRVKNRLMVVEQALATAQACLDQLEKQVEKKC
jgi:hypothetical protein